MPFERRKMTPKKASKRDPLHHWFGCYKKGNIWRYLFFTYFPHFY